MRRSLFLLLAVALGVVLVVPTSATAAPPSDGPSAPPVAEAAPAEVASPLTNAVSVAVGDYHSCAVLTNRQVRCWGYNHYGEIGNGTDGNEYHHAVVTKNAAGNGPLTNVTQLAVGSYHTCALLTNHQVRCWGYNTDGQLGTGDNTQTDLPVVVRNAGDTGPLTNVIQISAEYTGTCALLTNHQVRCWGDNDYSQLGDGAGPTDSPLPVTVKGIGGNGTLTGIASLGASYDNRCVVTQGGQGRCWGYSGDGALGDGTTNDADYPRRVLNAQNGLPLTGITQIGNGGYHGCALLTNHQVRCWGDNDDGELGSGGTNDNTRAVLARLPNGRPLTGVVSIGVGYDSTCALINSGQVRCWGDDGYAQNGDGTIESPEFRKFPNFVHGTGNNGILNGVRSMAFTSYHTCVVLSSGQVRCWGYNGEGELGNNHTEDTPYPVRVLT